jgi:hypothetical protein
LNEAGGGSEGRRRELCGLLSFRVRPDFDHTVRAGGDHLSGFRGMVLGPGDHFIVNPRGRVRLQDGGLIPVTDTDEKKTESANERSGWDKVNSHVKEVPSPDFTVFVTADDASFVEAEACPTSIRGVDVAFEVI